ncbi:MAG: CinA family protein [Thomasclavelia sp.]|jgi:nicotinamide-nucleotide amidase|nr:CinA family protein [Thomasclavelia sp.]
MSDLEKLTKYLIENEISISSVESFTVGTFGAMLGSIPGISKVYKGSLVTYQTETKERLLDISHDIIKKYGVVSKEIASLMCVTGKNILNSDICVSFTGNAGPDTMEGKPVGLVYVGIAYGDAKVYQLELKGERHEIVKQAIDFTLEKLLEEFKVN